VCSPPAAYGGPRSPLTRVREEALRRNRCAVVVDGLGAGEMEAGDTERAPRACATTRMWYRLWWWRSRQQAHEQRGVRGVRRGIASAAAVPAPVGCAIERRWELGAVFLMSHGTLVGRHACDTAHKNERGGERDVRAACGGGSPVVSPCMCQWGALARGVWALCPRNGVRRGSLAMTPAMEIEAYGRRLAANRQRCR
jgi:hypothetical protein